MRKKIILLVTAVPALLLFFSFSYLTFGLSSALCNVPASYPTVQAAVDDTNCDTINVAAGTYTEYVTINRDVVIEGAGVGTTVFDGDNLGRPFTILAPAANVTLRDMSIDSGQADLGGAIFNESALTLDTLFFTANDSTEDGGAVYSTNDLFVVNGFFQLNDADRDGGAIFITGSPLDFVQLDVTNTTFMVNTAVGGGGALDITYAETNLTDTYFDQNSAQTGGGINEFCGGVTMIGGSAGNHHGATLGGFYFGGCGSATDVLTLWNASILQNSSTIDGGAIYRTGSLEIHNSSLTVNTAAFSGGAIYVTENAEIYDSYLGYNIGHSGAAVYLAGGGGESILDNNRILQNTATNEMTAVIYAGSGVSMTLSHSELNINTGAGIYNAGTLTVYDTQIMTNTRGIYHATPFYPALISRSTIADNNLILPSNNHSGGGIRSFGSLTVRHSTINNNQALQSGGGIASNGPLTLTNVTVSGNRADDSGGGIWHNNDDPAILKGVTIYENIAGDEVLDDGNGGGIFIYSDVTPDNVTISNSIIAENTDRRNGDGDHPDCSGIIDSAIRDLLGIDTGCTLVAGGGNIIGTSASPETADLNDLADNGGATFTHEPQNSSPALNNGNCANLNADQRGVERVNGIGCDIGAYEDGTCPTPIVPDVDISLLYGNAILTWARDSSVQRLFKIYYSNSPYLDPLPDLIKRTIGDHYSYSFVSGGSVTTHDFFSIRSGNACGEMSGRAAVGVMEFAIEPGS